MTVKNYKNLKIAVITLFGYKLTLNFRPNAKKALKVVKV